MLGKNMTHQTSTESIITPGGIHIGSGPSVVVVTPQRNIQWLLGGSDTVAPTTTLKHRMSARVDREIELADGEELWVFGKGYVAHAESAPHTRTLSANGGSNRYSYTNSGFASTSSTTILTGIVPGYYNLSASTVAVAHQSGANLGIKWDNNQKTVSLRNGSHPANSVGGYPSDLGSIVHNSTVYMDGSDVTIAASHASTFMYPIVTLIQI
jgi:hypothetical protein